MPACSRVGDERHSLGILQGITPIGTVVTDKRFQFAERDIDPVMARKIEPGIFVSKNFVYRELVQTLLEVHGGSALSVWRMQLEASDEIKALIRQGHDVPVWQPLDDFPYATEQPDVRLSMKVDDREDIAAVKLVGLRSRLLPALPFFSTANEHIECLVDPVEAGEMNLVQGRLWYRPGPSGR